jgi:hypothetical protein
VFDIAIHFHVNIIFAGKGGAYQSGLIPLGVSTLMVGEFDQGTLNEWQDSVQLTSLCQLVQNSDQLFLLKILFTF